MNSTKNVSTLSKTHVPLFILILLIPYALISVYILTTNGILHYNVPFNSFLFASAFCTLISILLYQKMAYKISLVTNALSVLNRASHSNELLLTHIDLSTNEKDIQELVESIQQLSQKVYTSKHLLEESQSTLHSVMSRICSLKSTAIDSNDLIRLFLDLSIEISGTQSGCLFIQDSMQHYSIHTISGFDGVSKDRLLRHATSFLQWVEKERKAVIMPETVTKSEPFFSLPLLCFPLIYQKRYYGGIILSGNKEHHELSNDQIELIENLSGQISYTIENARFQENLERVYFETIVSLACAVEERDPYLRGHSRRVSEYATKIGKAMGLSDCALTTLHDASRLHDIGKAGITENIFGKCGPLTEEERLMIQKHPSLSENIITPLRMFQHLLDPIRHHHERLDGTGYPDGLSESEISIETRILTVSDIFDALTSERPYRTRLGITDVKRELAHLVKEGRIDRTVVTILFTLIEQGTVPAVHAN